jgi:hypothetical protein
MKTLRSVLLLGLLTAPFSREIGAQTTCTVTGIAGGTCTITRTITATVRRTVRVVVNPTVRAMTSPTVNDFVQGFQTGVGHTVTAQGNVNWQVTIRSTAANFTGTLGARAAKPRADLLWAPTVAGPWTAMTGVVAVLGTGAATAGTALPVAYRINWLWNLDTPGTYALAVQLTISST